jgi:MoaA/NifB/PqqE/SkfB family radical SAM enzyme
MKQDAVDTQPKCNTSPTPPPATEWSAQKRWNPFNSYKLLAHVERWKRIKRGKAIPAPVTVTVDPTNVCNFNCVWCNAEFIRKHRRRSLSGNILNSIADFLPVWGSASDVYEPGVKTVCVAGGGEPLLNPNTSAFIEKVAHNGVEVGVVTNGSRIDGAVDALSHCTWVGVSVDAGTAETFDSIKGLDPMQNNFGQIIDNMSILVDYSKRHQSMLGLNRPGYGVSYKYLLYKENIGEIFEAAKLAKEVGCKNIHFRPAGTPWDKIGTDEEIHFTPEEIQLFNQQMTRVLELDDANFNVYGVTHKFNEQFNTCNTFDKCYSIFMTSVIEPPADKDADKDAFVMGLCCDRRGDTKLELLSDETDVRQIDKAWGGKRHWAIHDRINVARECPRCTYQPHNQIYEQVILNDSMTYKFI